MWKKIVRKKQCLSRKGIRFVNLMLHTRTFWGIINYGGYIMKLFMSHGMEPLRGLRGAGAPHWDPVPGGE